MKPSIGRIVTYNTTELDRHNQRDRQACNEQEQLPAIITAVWSDTCVNLKVICDGEDNDWIISINQGDEEGNWNWPEKV